MGQSDVLLEAFKRVYESLHRTMADLSDAELIEEPHPPIGSLAWRLGRVMDNNMSRLCGVEQLWVENGWAARFGMPPDPAVFGLSHTHTREQVRAFRAPAELILQYHDAAYERVKTYIETLTAKDLARELDEPKYQPLPTVAVRLVSVLENAMNTQGQISYLKGYHRLGGWFPREAKDPASFR